MSKTVNVLLAGFGGQGILFAGKTIAYSGLMDNKEISWLPSYGPEMRGGTCNCHVILSDEPVSSPLITKPTVLFAMNQPSVDKFIDTVVEGGIVVYDSSLITEEIKRKDEELTRKEAEERERRKQELQEAKQARFDSFSPEKQARILARRQKAEAKKQAKLAQNNANTETLEKEVASTIDEGGNE